MNKRIAIIVGILLTILAVWVSITNVRSVRQFIDRIDNLSYDIQLRAKVFTQNIKPGAPIAIVDIDDRSLGIEGRWPWPRDKVAKLVDKLNAQGVDSIVFDILFAEKEANVAEELVTKTHQANLLSSACLTTIQKTKPIFDNDAILAKSLTASPVVLALGFLPTPLQENALPLPALTLTPQEKAQLNLIPAFGYISNVPILQQSAHGSGFINSYPDSDGIIRRAPLIINYAGKIYPSLALQAVLSVLNKPIQLSISKYGNTTKLEGVQIGDTIIPTDEIGQAIVPFIGGSFTFPYYSATDVLQDKIPKEALLGKIILIGTTAVGLGDLQPTAIQTPYPGVEVQATLINGMLQKNYFSSIPAWTVGANLIITIVFGLTAAFAFPYFGPRILGLMIILVPFMILYIYNQIWERTGLILYFLTPLLLIVLIAVFNIIYGYLFETRKREKLKTMFGQYVPEKHIDQMLKSSSNYALLGEDREMSVLFADIRNFTSISEGLSASELVQMLNTFFTPMTEIIFKNRGTIDKYVGDLIMAFWGAPMRDKNHRHHALQAALDMQKKVKEMRSVSKEYNWPEIHIGIGLNSGEMSVGDMGSKYRRNYTVLGDAVNLASRVEGLSKFYGVDIIVTEATQLNQKRFLFRKLDTVQVKGKKVGVNIYELVCAKLNATTDVTKELDLYHQALNLYFQQHWDEALVIFEDLDHSHPHTKIYEIYIKRVNDFKITPPPQPWNGVYTHHSK